jgi:hypothetical protein
VILFPFFDTFPFFVDLRHSFSLKDPLGICLFSLAVLVVVVKTVLLCFLILFMETFIHMESVSANEIDSITMKKMIFVYNAIEHGWTVKKREQSFVFQKKHEGKKEVFLDSFLMTFMRENSDVRTLLS